MYLSLRQVCNAIERLAVVHPFFGMTFLAFKKSRLPVGKKASLVFSKVTSDILQRHFKPSTSSSRYYSPFRTSDPANRWLSSRYGSTSLQRITTDTFGDTLLHDKGTSEWGWCSDYVGRLVGHLDGHRIPAFDLAVWLFRDKAWEPGCAPETVRDYLFEQYGVTENEKAKLFDTTVPKTCDMQEPPIPERELLDAIRWPPDVLPEEGLALHMLELDRIGPVRHLRYQPKERLNVITGDNSLGKTLLLDCVWWALTGEWADRPALPPLDAPKQAPRIRFRLQREESAKTLTADYRWEHHSWQHPASLHELPGLVVYARYDGSFAVWDPSRSPLPRRQDVGRPRQLLFRRSELWDGLHIDDPFEGNRWICNGLIRDWVNWQRSGESHGKRFKAFTATLAQLSPSPDEPLVPGEPARLPFDSRDMPTLRLPYGDIPIRLCSAGIQRIVALGYLLVWAWFEHLENSRQLRRVPQRTLVFLMDEVEAHLHPRWQRVIVPALISVVSNLAPDLRPQIHLATHSPMVMVGLEVVADDGVDSLHHLVLQNQFVSIETLPMIRRGRADRWLISEVFGLLHARSLEAEQAIERAKTLQQIDEPPPADVREAHERLVRYLAPDDEFWPRWVFFAKTHGADV